MTMTISTLAIMAIIIISGLYVLLFPTHYKKKIEKSKTITIRLIGIFIILVGVIIGLYHEISARLVNMLWSLGEPYEQCNIEEGRKVIYPFAVLSPNEDKMAFLSGTEKDTEGRRLSFQYGKSYILELENNPGNIIEIPVQKERISSTSAWSWRPNREKHELYLCTNPDSPDEPWSLLGIRITDKAEVFETQTFEWEFSTPFYLDWNPSGEILVMSDSLGNLNLSFDEGKSFTQVDGIAHSSKCAWKDDKTFYSERGDKLSEIKIENGSAKIERIIDREMTRLGGILDGKAVYTKDKKVFQGENILYENDGSYHINAYADGQFSVVQDFKDKNHKSSVIKVFDADGNIVNSRIIEAEVLILTIVSKDKYVYLLRDLQQLV